MCAIYIAEGTNGYINRELFSIWMGNSCVKGHPGNVEASVTVSDRLVNLEGRRNHLASSTDFFDDVPVITVSDESNEDSDSASDNTSGEHPGRKPLYMYIVYISSYNAMCAFLFWS